MLARSLCLVLTLVSINAESVAYTETTVLDDEID